MSNFRRRAATLGGDDFNDNYTQLKYIENINNAYIDTGVKPNSNTEIDTKLEIIHDPKWFAVFGCRGSGSQPAYSLWTNDTNKIYSHFSPNIYGKFVEGVSPIGIHNITIKNYVLDIDNIKTPIDSSPYQLPVSMYIFRNNENNQLDGGVGKMKLFWFKIWKNGTIVRDFYPAKRKKDGEIGLYDLVGKKFYLSPNGTKFSGMEYIPSGVYILNSQGQFITSDKWQGGTNNAVGIAVISSYYRYLTPVDWYEIPGCRWGTEGKVISGIVTSTDIYVADDDYYGVENTNKIIAQDSTSDAAKFCKDYKWPQCPYTLHGYLPAMGELIRLRDNFPSIRKCFEAMGLRIPYEFWSSTQSDSTRSWIVRFDTTDFDNYRPYPPYRGDKKINYQPLPISKI